MVKNGKIAVIDLGTNTFHLLIVEVVDGMLSTIHKEKIPVKIGEGGIDEGIITDIALARGIDTLQYFQKIIAENNITNIFATATSAFRNAKNQQAIKEAIKIKTGLDIDIIGGDEEAQLIYEGVRRAVVMDERKHLIMDIGGGSVEFIICNKNEVFWKQSFEIGGQRLMTKFHKVDPIPPSAITELKDYLKDRLTSLKNACAKHQPIVLIGASGSFDTLCEIYHKENGISFDLDSRTEYHLPFGVFHGIIEEIVSKDKDDRLAIPGMIEMRVNMIVVACLLIEYVVDNYGIQEIVSSTYALKEGLVYRNI